MIRFIFEAGAKLQVGQLTVATASCIYHKFFRECDVRKYDQHLVAAVSLYLAGKVEEDAVRIRNVINVCYRMLHPKSEPLGLGEEYWGLRDSLVQLELFVLRTLGFKVHFDHPHKYLLHYLMAMGHYLPPLTMQKYPLVRTSWAFVHDMLHDAMYLKHDPSHLAVAAMFLSLQCYGIEVPHACVAEVPWYQVLCDDLSEEKLWAISKDIMNVYQKETTVS